MSKLAGDESIALEVVQKPAEEFLPEQYIIFSKYAVQDRALVNEDGLKPVQKRIIWAGFRGGMTPTAEHLKASRFAAAANAYHPHASSSIEGALARMAQKFSLRVPLIDPYGSVGVTTGDTPAAARYWEARLTRAAMELVREVPEGAVELGKNFDGKEDEPRVLPVRWPVDIINGTQGIAVGFASNMFAHNPGEVMDAARRILKNPDLSIDQLLKIMPGPDLPTGGELFEVDGVRSYYETGSGRFTIRGRYRVDQLPRGKVRIVFHELPYQVSAEDIMVKVNTMQNSGGFKEIAFVKDLTDKKNGMKLVIETKAGANHLSVINELFKSTNLESKYSVNSTVLVDGRPVVAPMLTLLKNFLVFRRACTLRKADVRIEKIDHRLTQLNALLAVLVDIDKAIKIIRNADTADDARTELIAGFSTKRPVFTMTPEQADYILSMQLRRLTKADSLQITNEKKDLEAERATLDLVRTKEEHLVAAIDNDLISTKKIITDPRRTVISGVTADALKDEQKALAQAARDANKNLPCYITRFADGRVIKTDSPFSYAKSDKKLRYSPIIEQVKMKTQDNIIIVGSDGVGRRIPLSYLATDVPSSILDMGLTVPKGVELVGFSKEIGMKSDIGFAMASRKGEVKLSKTDFPKADVFPVFLLEEGDSVVDVRWIGRTLTNTYFVMVSASGNALAFDATSLRLAGTKAGGVKGMKLKDEADQVISFSWTTSLKASENMILSQGQKTFALTPLGEIPAKNKGGMGVVLHSFMRGETAVLRAHAGANLTAALDEVGNVVSLPTATRRASKGVEFSAPVLMGSFTVASQ